MRSKYDAPINILIKKFMLSYFSKTLKPFFNSTFFYFSVKYIDSYFIKYISKETYKL